MKTYFFKNDVLLEKENIVELVNKARLKGEKNSIYSLEYYTKEEVIKELSSMEGEDLYWPYPITWKLENDFFVRKTYYC